MTAQTRTFAPATATLATQAIMAATLLVDGSLRVIAAPAGVDLDSLGVRIALGSLCTGSGVLNDRLRSLVATGLAASLTVGDGAATVAISPMVATSPSAFGASLSVLVITPKVAEADRVDQVRANCGLTVSETEVLRLIFKGLSTVEAAGVLGISRTTVRTHLQHIFEKTETSRQSELVHFVATWH